MKYRIIERNLKYIVQFCVDDIWYSHKTEFKTLHAAKAYLNVKIEENKLPKIVYEVEV